MAFEKNVKALVLFSGGLDSILACKVLEEQGIQPIALQAITPFFGYEFKGNEQARIDEVKEKYNIDLMIVDITDNYLSMLRKPEHGYGRYLNPCIDCKILIIKKALSLLNELRASFIATGEVIGQRPMSQRRDTLRIIERDSGAEGLLLRPLCAKSMKPTLVEEQGLVDRNKLLSFSGRGRKGQIALAKKYSISDYPTPAGGCALADPILSQRFRVMLKLWDDLTGNDFMLAQIGRHFLLDDGCWFVVGRNQAENKKLLEVIRQGDLVLTYKNGPGPVGVMRRYSSKGAVQQAASLLLRYCKVPVGQIGEVCVSEFDQKDVNNIVKAERFSDEKIDGLWFVKSDLIKDH